MLTRAHTRYCVWLWTCPSKAPLLKRSETSPFEHENQSGHRPIMDPAPTKLFRNGEGWSDQPPVPAFTLRLICPWRNWWHLMTFCCWMTSCCFQYLRNTRIHARHSQCVAFQSQCVWFNLCSLDVYMDMYWMSFGFVYVWWMDGWMTGWICWWVHVWMDGCVNVWQSW